MSSINRISPGVFRLAGQIAGRPAVFLLDSGASSDFVDSSFAARAGLPLRPSRRAIKLADGTMTYASGLTDADCRLTAASGTTFNFRSAFYATKLQGYDAILGMTWLTRFDPRIEWSKGQIAVRHSEKDPFRALRPLAPGAAENRYSPAALHSLEGIVGRDEMRRIIAAGDVEEIYAMRIHPNS